MASPMPTIPVDWSLIEIWCCGKFYSSVDIIAHTELCHTDKKDSAGQIKYRSTRSKDSADQIKSRSTRSSSSPHDMEETQSREKSARMGHFGIADCKDEESRYGDVDMQSPKQRIISGRKSKMNAEVGLANTSRGDISDLKNLFDDANDIEGDREITRQIFDNKQDMFYDEDTLNNTEEFGKNIIKAGGGRVSVEKSSMKSVIAGTDKTQGLEDENASKSKINTDYNRNEVKLGGKTSVIVPQKIKIKMDKQDHTKPDKSEAPMIDIGDDSDTESVMFIKSIDTDYSCKVKNCLANFWFKSELEEHKKTFHKSKAAKVNNTL